MINKLQNFINFHTPPSFENVCKVYVLSGRECGIGPWFAERFIEPMMFESNNGGSKDYDLTKFFNTIKENNDPRISLASIKKFYDAYPDLTKYDPP